MARDRAELTTWLDATVETEPEPERDVYSVEKTYPWESDAAPTISYVELAWLGYYRVDPSAKGWRVTCCDQMVFVNADRRQAVREAQMYCTKLAREEDVSEYLPKPLRKIKPKVVTSGEVPF